MTQADLLKGIHYEGLQKSIICFLKVYLNCHDTNSPFFHTHGVKDFLEDDNSINYLPPWDETTLIRGNHFWENGFQPIDHDFSDYFVFNVSQTDGSQLSYLLRIGHLWDEG